MPTVERRHDLDWLRVFATYVLFPFHVGKMFDVTPFYHVKNTELVRELDLATLFVSLWHMPLFFVLAGWAVHASMVARGTDGLVRERLRRLGVPLLAGVLLFCPFLKYYEFRSGETLGFFGLQRIDPPYEGGFFEFLPTFFTLEHVTWAHLWFVAYLLTFTLLYRKMLVRRLAADARFRVPSRAGLYRPLLVLGAIQLVLRPIWPGGQNLVWDWANFAYYSTFFLLGFTLARVPAWENVIAIEWKRAGGIGLAACALLLGFWLAVDGNVWPDDPSVGEILRALPILPLTAVAGYCTLVAMLGFARRHLMRPSRTLDYLAESSLPVYILHQAAIVVPGYYITRLPLDVATKLLLVLTTAVAATLLVYHYVVRPSPWLRPLFGLKPIAAAQRTRRFALARRALALLLCAAVAATAGSRRADSSTLAGSDGYAEPSPLGLWYAEGGAARVEIYPCGEALCGRVAWLRSPFDETGCRLVDRQNADPALRARPVEGLEILSGLRPTGERGVWDDGHLYDPSSGYVYRATLAVDGTSRLRLRGYVGVPLLGRTTTWIRVGHEHESCDGPLASREP